MYVHIHFVATCSRREYIIQANTRREHSTDASTAKQTHDRSTDPEPYMYVYRYACVCLVSSGALDYN